MELKGPGPRTRKKQIIEHNNFYYAFLSDVYLLDYTKQPEIKQSQLKILMIINLMKVKQKEMN